MYVFRGLPRCWHSSRPSGKFRTSCVLPCIPQSRISSSRRRRTGRQGYTISITSAANGQIILYGRLRRNPVWRALHSVYMHASRKATVLDDVLPSWRVVDPEGTTGRYSMLCVSHASTSPSHVLMLGPAGMASICSSYRYVRCTCMLYECVCTKPLKHVSQMDRSAKIWRIPPIDYTAADRDSEHLVREDKPLFSTDLIHKARVLSITWYVLPTSRRD